MAANLKKFVNPRFITTIDLSFMQRLLARHEKEFIDFPVRLLEQDEDDARTALDEFLSGPEEAYPEGLRADLHRIAELGDSRGLEVIQTQAVRHEIDLFPDMQTGDEEAPNRAHDPKHIAVRVFLEHPELFDAAADHVAMMGADRLYEFAGQERGVAVDLTDEKVDVFRARVAALFRNAFHGDYCRVGDYIDGDEINLIIGHGSTVSTMPVVEGRNERVISVREIKHVVIRYSETTGMLGLARIRKAHRAEIAELFAAVILERPGFFEGDDAQDLYTLERVEREGSGFTFDHAYDPMIDRVEIIEAAVDLMVPGRGGYPRVERSLRSRRIQGDALHHLLTTDVNLAREWRLGELVFRIYFSGAGRRPPQVTVKIRPPGVVQFRRTQHEARVLALIERNGLMRDRDDFLVLDAAE